MSLVDSPRVFLVLALTTFVVQLYFVESYLIENYGGGVVQMTQNDIYNYDNQAGQRARVIVLYESLCPDCIDDYGSQILPTVQQLGQYINLNTYPYGNAQTSTDNKGQVTISCQHGAAECYGNMLHACAIEVLQHVAQRYVPYIACMMPLRSDDAAADQCGQKLQINTEAIKQCAKSAWGFQLLQYYGAISRTFCYNGVPTIFVNEQNINEMPLKQAVCRALNNAPRECYSYRM